MTEFVAGDTGSRVIVTCTDDATGAAIDLTGATVTMRWRTLAGDAVDRAMTVLSAVGGTAEYKFLAGELISPAMRIEYRVTDSSGNVIRALALEDYAVRAAL